MLNILLTKEFVLLRFLLLAKLVQRKKKCGLRLKLSARPRRRPLYMDMPCRFYKKNQKDSTNKYGT